MFNKLIAACAAAVLAVGVVGCGKEEKVLVANSAGLIAATTWIAVDNPSQNDIANVRSAVTVMKGAVDSVATGESIATALYPVASEWIVKNVDPHEQPLALAGTSVLLTALDLYFVSNKPEDLGEYVDLSVAFFNGVESGLALAPTHPMMMRARSGYEVRANALSL